LLRTRILRAVPEQRTVSALLLLQRVPWGTVTRRRRITRLPRALAELYSKQLHGRFPLKEADPPVGQDEPSLHTVSPTPHPTDAQ
jgi:hypothetical protein